MRETGRCAQLRGSPQRDVSRIPVVRGGCAIAGFVGFVGQVASWHLFFFYAREVDVQWGLGFELGVKSQART